MTSRSSGLRGIKFLKICRQFRWAKPRTENCRHYGNGDTNGTPTILPAEKYGRTNNEENPELYVAFPYRLYGVGKPGLETRAGHFCRPAFSRKYCWGQDGTESAILGLTAVAKKAAIAEFTDYGDATFPVVLESGA